MKTHLTTVRPETRLEKRKAKLRVEREAQRENTLNSNFGENDILIDPNVNLVNVKHDITVKLEPEISALSEYSVTTATAQPCPDIKQEGYREEFIVNEYFDVVSDKEKSPLPEFQNQALKSISASTNDIYDCQLCEKSYSSRNGLLKHNKIVHTASKAYRCVFCEKSFTWKYAFFSHISRHIGEYSVACNICRKTMKSYTSLDAHRLKYHSKNLIHRFECGQCKKTFNTAQYLKRHQILHMGNKLSSCSVCKAKFSLCDLNDHMKTHSGKEIYKCNFCSNSFNNKASLRNHTNNHLGIRPYKCNYCEKRFLRKSALNRHIMTHSNTRLHQCIFCGKFFSQKNMLEDHIYQHIGEQHYHCKICEAVLSSRMSFQRHLRLDCGKKRHYGSVCCRAFLSTCALRQHKKSCKHCNQVDVSCVFCGQTFNRPGDYRNHIRQHIGEVCYKCDICQAICKTKRYLKIHMRMHSNMATSL